MKDEMSNKDDTVIVPIDYHGTNRYLLRWLRNMPNVVYASDLQEHTFLGQDHLIVWRNCIAEKFLEESNKDYLMMIDDDIIIDDRINPLIESTADVSGARFFAKTGCIGHDIDGVVSMACVKISRRALNNIPRPWFKFCYNPNHTQVTMCECEYFCKKARESGIFPIKAGLTIHKMPVAVLPPHKEGDSCRMKFLHQLENNRAGAELIKNWGN